MSGFRCQPGARNEAQSSKRSEGVSYLDQTGCFLAGGRAYMKLQEIKSEPQNTEY